DERDSLQRSESDDPFVRHAEWVRESGFATQSGLNAMVDTGLSAAGVHEALCRLNAAGEVMQWEPDRWVHRDAVAAAEARTLAFLARRHQTHPHEPGEPRDRLVGWIDQRSAQGCGRFILGRMEAAGRVLVNGPFVAHASFKPA